jgi:hypothetical protein
MPGTGKRRIQMDTNKEICIRCGKETEYDVSAPVDIRRFYVEGFGQLCEECWRELYPIHRGQETNKGKRDA